MKHTYWMTPPGLREPWLACLDAAQVALYKEQGAKLKRDDYCEYLDGNGRAVRGQKIPKPSPEEVKRRKGRRRR